MLVEIVESGYHLTHEVWTNPNKQNSHLTGLKYLNPRLGWSSGPTALKFATSHNPHEIFIFGFDYVGDGGLVNNVYADTLNYKKSTENATYYGNWENQTHHIIKENQHIKFFRVVGDTFYSPKWKYTNFKNINYTEFYKMLNTWK